MGIGLPLGNSNFMVGGMKVIIENFLPKKREKLLRVSFCFFTIFFFDLSQFGLEKLKKKVSLCRIWKLRVPHGILKPKKKACKDWLV